MTDSAILYQTKIEVKNTKPRLVSLETYLNREAKSVHKHEFLNGNIVKTPRAKAKHNQIAAQFTSALIVATTSLHNTYIVYNSDMKIYIPVFTTMRYILTQSWFVRLLSIGMGVKILF